MTLCKRIGEYEPVPHGYGTAYKETASLYTVCYPLGLNAVVVFLRNILYRLKMYAVHDQQSIELANYIGDIRTIAFHSGFQMGQLSEQGRKSC